MLMHVLADFSAGIPPRWAVETMLNMQFEPQTLWVFVLSPGLSPQCCDTLVAQFIYSSASSAHKVEKDNKTRDFVTYLSSLWKATRGKEDKTFEARNTQFLLS